MDNSSPTPSTEQAQSQSASIDTGSSVSTSVNSATLKGHAPRPGILIFCPHRLVETVWQVTPEELKRQNVEGVILDLDNTLVRWQQEEMAEEVTAWLTSIRKHDLKISILSNSVLSRRSERIAEKLGCPNVRQARKPSRDGFRRAMAAMGTVPENTAIVGDQMFTDIWGGNRTGIYTIMVEPIHEHEFAYTRYVSRPPERTLLKWFKRKGLL